MAASGGGHLLEVLELRPALTGYDTFFVTENTARSQTLEGRSYYVDHFALGQARLGVPLRMLRSALNNLLQSFKIVTHERPDVLISTGAGAVFFTVLWARLFGAKVIIVESLARFNEPSLFVRLSKRLANDLVVQSASLVRFCPGASLFDPVSVLNEAPPVKQPLLFVTVGTVHPFERMVEMVASLKCRGLLEENVIMQIGIDGAPRPDFDATATLPFDVMRQRFSEARIVVCHGGVGSIMLALRYGCQVIAVPRLARLREHYDDHQSEITQALQERGLIQVANNVAELEVALTMARRAPARSFVSDPSALIAHVDQLLRRWLDLAEAKRSA